MRSITIKKLLHPSLWIAWDETNMILIATANSWEYLWDYCRLEFPDHIVMGVPTNHA